MKILINSYWCCPGMASEPGVAWRYIEGLHGRGHDITVVTGSRYREALRENQVDGIEFIFIENTFHEKISAIGAKMGLGAVFGGIYHYFWQIKAFLHVLLRGHKFRSEFDVFHHLNSFSWRWPPLLVFLFDKTLWGPIGGGQGVPAVMAGGRGLFLQYVRPFLQALSRLDPVLNLCMWRVSCVLCANSDTYEILPSWVRRKSCIKLETAINVDLVGSNHVSVGKTALVVGNLVALKGVDIVIKAFRLVVEKFPEATLNIVGDGVDRIKLENLSRDLGLNNNIKFYGKIPFLSVKNFYRQSNVFIWGSLQDTSGNVVLEALSEGVPVVGIDTGGTRDIVKNFVTGLKIPPGPEDQVVHEMASAVCMLLQNPQLRNWMSRNCHESAKREYSWDGLVSFVEERYLWLCGGRS